MTIKFGIVGLDSSHGDVYSRLLNGGYVPGMQATVLSNEDPARAAELSQKNNIPHIADSPEALMKKCDGVLVCARWGEDHLRLATPYLKAGMPTFVDKPIADSEEDAKEILRLANEHGAPLMSGSALRHAKEVVALREEMPRLGTLLQVVSTGTAYSQMEDPRARHLAFYGFHMAEILVDFQGIEGQIRYARYGDEGFVAVREAAGRPLGILNLLRQEETYFHLVLYGSEGVASCEITDADGYYGGLLAAVGEMVRTGKPTAPPEEALVTLQIVLELEKQAA